jgi:O-antigen/teichoic acid export membrane protein
VLQNFLVRIAMLCLSFGTGIIVARSLQPVGRGEQAAMALWPILVAGLATLGIPTALKFCTRRHAARAGSLLVVAEAVAIVVGFVAAGIGALALPFLLHDYDAGVVRDAQWLMVLTPQILLLYVVRAHLESQGEFLRSIFGQLIMVVFTLIALAALSAMQRLTPLTAALSYYVPGVFQTLWLAVRLRTRMRICIAEFIADVRTLFSFGLRSYGSDLVNALSLQLDQVVIVAFLTPRQLGLYAVALSLSRVINVAQESTVMVLFPYASGLATEDALAVVGRAVRKTNAVALVLATLFLLVTPFAVPWLYGRGFASATSILPLLTAEAVLGGSATVLGQAFSATGRPGVVTFVQAAWLGIVLVLLDVLVPRLNLVGAAVALLLASVARLGLVALAYRIAFGRPTPQLIPDATDLRELVRKLRGVLQIRAGVRAADVDQIRVAEG